jgi:hypothetical protein
MSAINAEHAGMKKALVSAMSERTRSISMNPVVKMKIEVETK